MAREKAILVISDDKALLIMLKKMLSVIFPGIFRVDIARGLMLGSSFLEYDIIICDLDLGKLDCTGINILARAKEINHGIRTVLMSGNFFIFGTDGKTVGRDVGIDAFLDKPFPMKAVGRRISDLAGFPRRREWCNERKKRRN